jgi:hypothetical protein
MLDRLTEDQRKVLMMWFFLLIFLIGLVVLIANNKIKKRVVDEKYKTYVVVRDYSRYYTITNILDKYYTTIYNKNYESVIKMLDADYVKDNNITKDNLEDFIKTYDARTTYQGSLMCSKRLGKGYTSYYVSGEVVGANSYKIYDTKYYEVLLNENQVTFTVKEIDSNQFGGECHV